MVHGSSPGLARALSSLLDAVLADASLADLWRIRAVVTKNLNVTETDHFEKFFGRLLNAYEEHLGTDARILRLDQYSETLSNVVASDNLEAVLSSLTEGVRRIADSDTAFLALRDTDNNDVRMKLTRGTVSAEMQNLRLELGTGIGGSVSVTGELFSTDNYLTDSRISHDADVDKVVNKEGLQRLYGLPLVSDAEVLGVMFASNRSARRVPAEAQSSISHLLQNTGNLVSWIKRAGEQTSDQAEVPRERLVLSPSRRKQHQSPALGVLLNQRLLHPHFSHYMSELDSLLIDDCVLVVTRPIPDAELVPSFGAYVAPFTKHWCTVQGNFVMLVPAGDSDEAVRGISRAATNRVHVVSANVADVSSLWNIFMDLDSELSTLEAREDSGVVSTDADLYSVIFGGQNELAAFVRRYLTPIWEFDTQNNGEIGLTLATYLSTGLHHRATAERLHIHANTLYRRFENVNRVLGNLWSTELDLVELQLALRIAHLVPEMAAWSQSWTK